MKTIQTISLVVVLLFLVACSRSEDVAVEDCLSPDLCQTDSDPDSSTASEPVPLRCMGTAWRKRISLNSYPRRDVKQSRRGGAFNA